MSPRFPRHRRNPVNFSEVRSSMKHIRPSLFFQFLHFLSQLIGRCAVFFLVGILDLVTELADCAIGFDLGRSLLIVSATICAAVTTGLGS
jgi:hypothetical protein